EEQVDVGLRHGGLGHVRRCEQSAISAPRAGLWSRVPPQKAGGHVSQPWLRRVRGTPTATHRRSAVVRNLAMIMRIDERTCTSSPRRSSAPRMLGALALALGGCVLTGIEPDEIDVAVDTGSEGVSTGNGTDDGVEELGDGDGDEGDPTGDGDPGGDGDGDGDPTGDGDGDPTGDGDGDGDPTGDGDGDPTGDGDGDPGFTSCADFRPEPVVDGPNSIEVPLGNNSFTGSCGGANGPDAIFSYTATSEGLVSFALEQAEFDGVIYLAGETCVPLDQLGCDAQ